MLPTQSDKPIARHVEFALLGGLLAVVTAFHFATLHRQSWFVDEANEITIASLPLGQIVVERDSMPPLYSILLKGWIEATSIEQARWLSAIGGLLSTLAIWYYTRRLWSPTVALVTAVMFAIFPLQMYYAQLVRAYSVFTLLVIVAVGELLLAWRRNDRKHWACFVAASVAGLYTHYYFGLVLTALLILCVWKERRPRPAVLISAACILLAGLPLLGIVAEDFTYQQSLREPRYLDWQAVAYTYAVYFSGYSLGPSVPELQTLSGTAAMRAFAPWGLGIAAGSLPLLVAGLTRLSQRGMAGPAVTILIIPLFLVGSFGWLLGLTYNPRFLAWGVAPLAVILATGILQVWPRWWGRMATVTLVALMLTAIGNRTFVARYQNEDLRSACAYINEHGAEGEVVLLVSDYLDRTIGYYLPRPFELVLLPYPGETNHVVDSQEGAKRAVSRVESYWQAKGRQQGWLVYSRPFHGDPKGLLIEELATRFHVTEVAAHASGVRLFRVAPRPEGEVTHKN